MRLDTTKEEVLEISKQYREAEKALRILFPTAFHEINFFDLVT